MMWVVGHKVQVTAMETVEMKVKCSIIKLVIGKIMKTIMKCKPNWIYLKTQGYENGTIWKRIRVTGALAGDKFAIRTSSII